MSSAANIGCFKWRREMFEHILNWVFKVTSIYKTQKILQLKNIY